MIIYYYGTGKGKTSAGLGALLRAKAAGKNVLLLQFLKNNTIESKSLNGYCFGDSSFVNGSSPEKKHFVFAKTGLSFFEKKQKDCDVIMLDELGMALYYGLLDKKEVVASISKFQGAGYPVLIITGRIRINVLEQISDIVTEMKEKKHIYKKGIKALEGIDY